MIFAARQLSAMNGHLPIGVPAVTQPFVCHIRLRMHIVSSPQSWWVALVAAGRTILPGGLFGPVMRRLSARVCACILLQPAHATELAQPAKMLEASAPEYPSAARRRDDQGTVHVRVRVLASGQASEVQVQSSSGIPDAGPSGTRSCERFEIPSRAERGGRPGGLLGDRALQVHPAGLRRHPGVSSADRYRVQLDLIRNGALQCLVAPAWRRPSAWR